MKKLISAVLIIVATTCIANAHDEYHHHAKRNEERRPSERADGAMLMGRHRSGGTVIEESGQADQTYDNSSCDSADVQEIDVSKHAAWNALATIAVALTERYLCERSQQSVDRPSEKNSYSQCVRPTPVEDLSREPNSDFEWFARWQQENGVSAGVGNGIDSGSTQDNSMDARLRSLAAVTPLDTAPAQPAERWDIAVVHGGDGDQAVLVRCS
ncbi:MAG: hypothetical protein ACREHV_09460 [Rhizomicrobium sp.]